MIQFKILPILIVLAISLIVRSYNLFTQITSYLDNKRSITMRTIFINDIHAAEHSSEGDSKSKHEGGEKKKEDEPPASQTLKENRSPEDIARICTKFAISNEYSPEEVKLLQNLAKRKDALDKSQKEIDIKAQLLNATELKVEKKISELKDLKSKLDNLLAQYNEKENMKIQSLVKIYENMKPKDAAKILEALDMPILLQVINSMKESKVAPILSNINPIRAKEISTEFANQRKLSE
jgi:flagellar motility protein MotE (MotC chaperone)